MVFDGLTPTLLQYGLTMAVINILSPSSFLQGARGNDGSPGAAGPPVSIPIMIFFLNYTLLSGWF